MHHAQRAELDKTGRDLCPSDEGGGGNRRRCARTGDFEEARQMRGHHAGDKPSRGEDEREDRHRSARGRRRFSFDLGRADRRRRARNQQPVQGQPDQNVQRRPDKARSAPTKLRVEKG